MNEYEQFIASKHEWSSPTPVAYQSLSHVLFPFQAAIVRWALNKGRAAIFADTGLGKTLMQLEWARHVSQYGRVLIVAPLAVSGQTVRESSKIEGVAPVYRERDAGDLVTITNYERVQHFDPAAFSGVVLDESSILKSFDGATRNLLIGMFSGTKYRLACTATPAPNDHGEIGNHAEFLGVKRRTEMLSEFFINDGDKANQWRLKRHAIVRFWDWVSMWGLVCRKPSDLGFSDDGFDLPDLRMHNHRIPISHTDLRAAGFLLAPPALGLSEQRSIRRATISSRVAAAVEICDTGRPVIVWCEFNVESEMLAAAIPGAVQIQGKDDPHDKISRLLAFADGGIRVLVTKPSIAGFGMNWQHCNRMVFLGPSHSYEQTYQSIRRCWRFGQSMPVDVFVISSELEASVQSNYLRKSVAADLFADQMRISAMAQVDNTDRAAAWDDYKPEKGMMKPWASMVQKS